jgi:hypothetical protein
MVGLSAVAFGILTVLAGGRALFGGPEARAAVGDAVPFVLWFNFLAGFAYGLAGIGIALRRPWAAALAAAIAAATVLVFLAFGLHVLQGGAFETRTVFAMLLRSSAWIAIAVFARRSLGWPGSPVSG